MKMRPVLGPKGLIVESKCHSDMPLWHASIHANAQRMTSPHAQHRVWYGTFLTVRGDSQNFYIGFCTVSCEVKRSGMPMPVDCLCGNGGLGDV